MSDESERPGGAPRGGGFRLFSGLLALALVGLLLLTGSVDGRRSLYVIAFRNDLATVRVVEHIIRRDGAASGAIVALIDSRRRLPEDLRARIFLFESLSSEDLTAALPSLCELWALSPEGHMAELPSLQWNLVRACRRHGDGELREALVELYRTRDDPDIRMRLLQALNNKTLSDSTKEEMRRIAAGMDHPWLHRDVLDQLGGSEAFEQLAVPMWQETVLREPSSDRGRTAFRNLDRVVGQTMRDPEMPDADPRTSRFEQLFGPLFERGNGQVRDVILDAIQMRGGPPHARRHLRFRKLHRAILDGLEELSPRTPVLPPTGIATDRQRDQTTLPERLRTGTLGAIAFLDPEIIVEPALARLETARPGVKADLLRALSYNLELFARIAPDERVHPLLAMTPEARAEVLQPFLEDKRYRAVRPHALTILEIAVEAPELVLPMLLDVVETGDDLTRDQARWSWLSRRPGSIYDARRSLRRVGDYLQLRPDADRPEAAELVRDRLTPRLREKATGIARDALRYRSVEELHAALRILSLEPLEARAFLRGDPVRLTAITKMLKNARVSAEVLLKKGTLYETPVDLKRRIAVARQAEAQLARLGVRVDSEGPR